MRLPFFTGKPNYPSGKFAPGYTMFNKKKEIWEGITVYRVPLIPRGNSSGTKISIKLSFFCFFLMPKNAQI
jgi:hypothetical protein